MTYDVIIDGTQYHVEIEEQQGETWRCHVDGQEIIVDAAFTARDVISMLVNHRAHEIKREYSMLGDTHIIIGSERFAAEVRDPRSLRSPAGRQRALAKAHRKLLPLCPAKLCVSWLPKRTRSRPSRASSWSRP